MLRYNVTARRDLLLGGAAALLLSGLLVRIAPVGAEQTPAPAEPWEDDLKRILGGAKPGDAKMSLEIADVSDNGNTVPFTIGAESPMSPQDYVKGLHLIATGNPQPLVASFRLSPLSGLAQVQSRMRLVKSQEIVGVAEFSNGTFGLARRAVKVNIACCGY
jgi:sulfur-oxidizing protein SoxY